MKKYSNMETEDKLLGPFDFGEIDPGKRFKSTRRPIDVYFRTDYIDNLLNEYLF